MIKTSLKELSEIIDKYGNDVSGIDLTNKRFRNVDLTNVILPRDKELLRKATYKSINNCVLSGIDFQFYNMKDVCLKGSSIKSDCILPKDENFFVNLKNSSLQNVKFDDLDLSVYSFDNVDITNTSFAYNVKLPKDRELFKKIKNQSLLGTVLPKSDYSIYNFEGVSIKGAIFTEDSILDKNKNLFQGLKDKSLAFCRLPSGDYRLFDFKEVSLLYSTFQGNSILPEEYGFAKMVSTMQGSDLGDNYNKNVHLYDFSDIPYNIEVKLETSEQEIIFYKKYEKELLNGKIKLK